MGVFSIMLFLICFFRHFIIPISVDYQYVTNSQQDFKKNIIRKPPTEVHTYRCTKEELMQLQTLAKECGLSLSRYVVETGLKHRPRMRLTKDEVDALNSLAIARTDLIKISNVLSKKTAEEKARFFKNEKFMRWWIDAIAGLIQHWYSIEENIATNVQTQSKEQL